MTIHSSILAWRTPWTEQPDGLQSIGLQRVRHNWATQRALMIGCLHTLGNYHCDKSTNNLVFNKVVTTLLTIFFMLVSYFHDFLLCYWRFVPLNSLHLFHLPHPLPSGNHVFFLYESVFIFLNFFNGFHISVRSYSICLSLFVTFYLISTPLSIHVVTNGKVSFSMAEWSSTIYIPPCFLYPFNYWYAIYVLGTHFGSLQQLFLQIFFSPFLFLLSFWDSYYLYVGVPEVFWQVCETLFIFLQSYFPFLLRLDDLYLSIFKLAGTFFLLLKSAVEWFQ